MIVVKTKVQRSFAIQVLVLGTIVLTDCRGLCSQDYAVFQASEKSRVEDSSRVVLDVLCTNLVKHANTGVARTSRQLLSTPKSSLFDMTLKVQNMVKGVIDTDELNASGWRELTGAENVVLNLPVGFTNGFRMRIGFDNYTEGAFQRLKLMPWNREMADIFPSLPPIAKANPSVRHSMSVRLPTGLRVSRTDNTLTIGWASLQETNLTVGTNMVVGRKMEKRLLRNGVPEKSSESECEFNEWFGGISIASAADFGSSNTVLHRKEGHALLPASAYSVECHCVVFETDIPPQHMWQPTSGKYRVLSELNFKETAKDE